MKLWDSRCQMKVWAFILGTWVGLSGFHLQKPKSNLLMTLNQVNFTSTTCFPAPLILQTCFFVSIPFSGDYLLPYSGIWKTWTWSLGWKLRTTVGIKLQKVDHPKEISSSWFQPLEWWLWGIIWWKGWTLSIQALPVIPLQECLKELNT